MGCRLHVGPGSRGRAESLGLGACAGRIELCPETRVRGALGQAGPLHAARWACARGTGAGQEAACPQHPNTLKPPHTCMDGCVLEKTQPPNPKAAAYMYAGCCRARAPEEGFKGTRV